jgi:VanZ family protein
MRRALLWLPPLFYMALIFYLSSQSEPMPAVTARVWDKALHFTEYAVLCVLLCRALHGEGLATLRLALLAAVLTSAYGASDEVHQSFVPERQADADDWLADTTGAAAAAALFSTALHLRRPLRRSPPGRSDRPTAPAARAARLSAAADRSLRAADRE